MWRNQKEDGEAESGIWSVKMSYKGKGLISDVSS